MTKDEFNDKFQELQEAFDHRVKETVARQYWNRVSTYITQTWMDAVEMIIRTDERFPKVSRVLDIMELVHHKRKANVALSRKAGQFDQAGNFLGSIPFPPNLKKTLAACMDKKIPQEDLEFLCKKYADEHRRPGSCPHDCIEGFIRYRKKIEGHGIRTFVAKCDCVLGQDNTEKVTTVQELGL